MKTQTRAQIIKIIKKNREVRPAELVRTLGISPQAIHRHLKALVEKGVIVPQGKPPVTAYALAGVPNFSNALQWFQAERPPESPKDFVCATRDVFSARLSQFKPLLKHGLSLDDLSLIIAVVGEIGNNSFDHNLGQWKDIPGCWFEIQTTGGLLWVCIADRGQGVYRSLSRVIPSIPDDQAALELAFKEAVSGRAPEKRGNGLKYVKSVVTGGAKRGLACRSGRGQVFLGEWGENCRSALDAATSPTHGTMTVLAWSLEK